MSKQVDVVVVGLGPGGEYVATQLAEAGLSVVAVDQHLVGGECPYYACVPTKMMVRAAGSLAEGRRIPELAGTSTVATDWAPVAKRIAAEATDDWDDTVAVERVEAAGVQFVRGHARLTGKRAVRVDNDTYEARVGVVLNPGTSPGVPSVEGLADTPYWTNRDIAQLTELPESLLVIGGGAVGAELSQIFARFDVAVTLVEVADRILALEEPESSAVVTEVFRSEGINVLTGATIDSVEYRENRFRVRLGSQLLEREKLLVAAGRTPNLSGLGLETVGLDPSSRSLDVDEWMRVADGLWAIGDVTGKGAYTHMSMYQADVAVRGILDRGGPAADYRAVSRVTFTDPEVGSVGLTERQAREQGLNIRTGQVAIASSARGWIHGVGTEGLIKLIEDADRGVIVGATSVGPTGGEVLAGLTLAVHAEVPTGTLRSMIYAYPTFHRAISDALADLS